ncbi:alpha-amylase family glycosyl hydrolase [Thiorhodovibrio frisius]|uniref:Glycosidase n=1 Tax=Thiorhodovibrio frisius TaxID=631362 RepID=H8Z423_9GAMM|nr:alpha-amylase family glycosyl hydrolase [Thiorhodovibrio frisius]EIC20092.1 glycosidase [Thiorhodovibrio frisius]WPL20822.1 Alpha-1,4-glucan:maltose-1-phosphate maltosyltransferase 1 [Thiorhodovibrio frisius]
MIIYNLFPLLAGPFPDWTPHFKRAAAMGFDWIFVNPVQALGASGSLYSISDYFGINQVFVGPGSLSSSKQLRAACTSAEKLGLKMMTDLVINHCAIDSPLVKQHPQWFVMKRGKPANPFCVEPDGSKVIWRDLAQFDHRKSADKEGMLAYFVSVVEHLTDLGFRGFRCDAAYQLPAEFWQNLIGRCRAKHPDIVFVAETLGCSPKQTKSTAAAGFDAIYNSAKWWDFTSPWLLTQYALTRSMLGSISFPESHDTERLFSETDGNLDAMRQRYLFAALFSSHVMMPMGFEYGFRKRLHVVNTRPTDWEEPNIDLTDFITQINGIKKRSAVFSSEGPIEQLTHPNEAILILRKKAAKGSEQALLILNKDPHNNQHLHLDDLYALIDVPPPLHDLSPDWPMDYLPTPFEFDLGPGVARVLTTDGDKRP